MAFNGADCEYPPLSLLRRAAQAAWSYATSTALPLPPRREREAEVRIPALLPARGHSYQSLFPAGRFLPDPRVAPVADRQVSPHAFHSPASYPDRQSAYPDDNHRPRHSPAACWRNPQCEMMIELLETGV